MTHQNFAAIILAAGRGTRMKSDLHKPLHQVANKPMVRHVVDACSSAGADRIIVVKADDDPYMSDVVAPFETAVQKDRRGTAHATQMATKILGKYNGKVLVTIGDMPLIEPETIKKMIAAENDITLLAMRVEDPLKYGRLITDVTGKLHRIVEFKDATDEEKSINLCNSGAIVVRAELLEDLLSSVKNDNVAGEFYLYDIIAIANERGLHCAVIEGGAGECSAANSREELAGLENVIQTRLRSQAMAGGATLVDPKTVYFSTDTKIGQDVIVEPNVFFGPGVVIGNNVTIKSFCRLENVTLESGAIVGPFENTFSQAKNKDTA